jgi:glutamine amidotransferase PdxT
LAGSFHPELTADLRCLSPVKRGSG